MFAARGFRLSALFVALLAIFSVMTVDTAEARRGGSFGSRGTRTYQTAPATPTSPSVTAPVQRTTAAPTSTNRAGATQAQAQRPGWFGGGIGGAILGGLLFSGLFGMMFGMGFGGFGGMLALLFQVVIIGLIAMWFFGRRRQTAPAGAGAGTASAYAARQDWQPGGGTAQPRANASGASQRAGKRDEVGISNNDLDQFEQRLTQLQDAYSREDYESLRHITTPEMMGYLAEELGTNASKGLRNEVYEVKLLSGDISEAWREGADQYATVALRYESRDVNRDRSSGQIVAGEDGISEVTELWTFVRRGAGSWLVSAIQEA